MVEQPLCASGLTPCAVSVTGWPSCARDVEDPTDCKIGALAPQLPTWRKTSDGLLTRPLLAVATTSTL